MQIVQQGDDWLESTHDYIQWLFPLEERSRVTPGAPVLLPADIQAFRSDPQIQRHLHIAFNRMLGFYGLAIAHGKVSKASNWEQRSRNWFTQPTHNNLRITRILKCLMLLGLDREAMAYYTCLRELCTNEDGCAVPHESQGFWKHAISSTSRGA